MGQKKALERIGIGIGLMFGVYWFYSLFLSERISLLPSIQPLFRLFVLYGVGLALFLWVIRGIPSTKPTQKPLQLPQILLCFLLQFSALLLIALINMLGHLTGSPASTQMQPVNLMSIVLLLLLAPLLEEFVFRKILADRLLIYGEGLFILASSFFFAVIHGFPLGIPQMIYTFCLGMIWSYAYVMSGNIWIPILLHSLSNAFGSVFLSLANEADLLIPYTLAMMILGILGIVLLVKYRKRIVVDGKNFLVNQLTVQQLLLNRGTIFFIIVSLVAMIVKNVRT